MARKKRKRKFKYARRGVQIEGNILKIICALCNLTREFERNGEDTDQILDREAFGWYTIINGIALCPRHVVESGAATRPLHPLSEIIYGDPEARKEIFDQFLERTRRRMERLSWRSATSEDSTTSETS